VNRHITQLFRNHSDTSQAKPHNNIVQVINKNNAFDIRLKWTKESPVVEEKIIVGY
jgi:hypothetical protein